MKDFFTTAAVFGRRWERGIRMISNNFRSAMGVAKSSARGLGANRSEVDSPPGLAQCIVPAADRQARGGVVKQ